MTIRQLALVGVATLVLTSVLPAAADAATLSAAEAKRQAIKALDEIVSGFQRDGARLKCRRRSSTRFTCRVRYRDVIERYNGTLTVFRSGTPPDLRYRYTARLRHIVNGRRRGVVRPRGGLPERARTAKFGQGLTLLGQETGEELRVVVERLVDPLPPDEFDDPTPGTRYVGVLIDVASVGSEETDDSSWGNATRLLLPDGRTLQATFSSPGDCNSDSGPIPLGQNRRVCVPFELPHGQAVRSVDVTLDSGFGPETGQWMVP